MAGRRINRIFGTTLLELEAAAVDAALATGHRRPGFDDERLDRMVDAAEVVDLERLQAPGFG